LPNTVIDFGGYVDKHIPAIIRKSDLVIMPTTNHISSLKRNIKALEELTTYNDNIIVVVTMTKKKTDFDEVKTMLKDFNIKAFFELKDTNIFNNSLDKGMSIEEYANSSNLIKSAYGKKKNQKSASILEQWNELITYIKNEIEG
jgi:glutaredoxin-related protein